LGKKGFDMTLTIHGEITAPVSIRIKLMFADKSKNTDQKWLKLINDAGKSVPVPIVLTAKNRSTDIRIQVNTVSGIAVDWAFAASLPLKQASLPFRYRNCTTTLLSFWSLRQICAHQLQLCIQIQFSSAQKPAHWVQIAPTQMKLIFVNGRSLFTIQC
jgi:hypothetical protein